MFIDEINKKVEEYIPPEKSEKEKKKELKQQQKMEKKIEEDAQYLWIKLQVLYERYVPYFAEKKLKDKSIKFKITNARGYNPHYIYYSIGYDNSEYLLSRKRITYPQLTLDRLKEIALENKLEVDKNRYVPQFQDLRRTPELEEYYYQFSFPKNQGVS